MNNIKRKYKTILACIALIALTAIPIVAATADISWPASPPEQQVLSYNVYVATNGTSNPQLLGSSASTNLQANLAPGYQYYVTVRAVNLTGQGGASPATATPPLPSAPGAPTVNISP